MLNINLLKQIGSIRRYKEDEYIFNEGEPGEEMFIILSGSVEVYIRNMDGFYIKASEIGPGGFFGEMSILEDMPRSATIVASGETIAISINKSAFQAFIHLQPELAYNIMKALSSRVRGLNEEFKKLKEGTSAPMSRKSKASPSNSVLLDGSGSKAVINELFPTGHKQYELDIPQVYNDYVFDKQVQCFVCGKEFPVKKQRLSKLKVSKVESDFRQRYVDFEPLLYSVWVCPHCFYSNFYYEFDAIPESYTRKVINGMTELKKKFDYKFSSEVNINDVLTSYYMALYNTKFYPPNGFKLAKLWLQLSWLYKDVNDEEMFKYSSDMAFENYYESIYNCKTNLTIDQEQKCYIVLAELFLLRGEQQEALKHFMSAKRKNGSEVYNKIAEDRIFELKNSKNK